MQLNLLDVRVRAGLLLSSECCIARNANGKKKKGFTLDKVYAVCPTHSNRENSNDLDLELFV
jgi:hypothetical protein